MSLRDWMLMAMSSKRWWTQVKSIDYLRAVAVRANADADSYFEKADCIAYAQEVMEDYKTLGNWDSYLAMDKWIQSLLDYTAKNGF